MPAWDPTAFWVPGSEPHGPGYYESLVEHHARRLTCRSSYVTPMRQLLHALANAVNYIHFTTWGISWELAYALTVASHRCEVHGVVAGLDNERTEAMLADQRLDGDMFFVHAVKRTEYAAPHQKVIIVDGLLAFYGSTNLTLNGWHKAAEGPDQVEITADVEQVAQLNNRYFARVWWEYERERGGPEQARWEAEERLLGDGVGSE